MLKWNAATLIFHIFHSGYYVIANLSVSPIIRWGKKKKKIKHVGLYRTKPGENKIVNQILNKYIWMPGPCLIHLHY